jgi:hypothetical protein
MKHLKIQKINETKSCKIDNSLDRLRKEDDK